MLQMFLGFQMMLKPHCFGNQLATWAPNTSMD